MPEFDILKRLGYLDSFPRRFRHGFEVRDAWRNVLDTEPVQAVLCADDSNPYTRIPLLLARARKLPTSRVIMGRWMAATCLSTLTGMSFGRRGRWKKIIWCDSAACLRRLLRLVPRYLNIGKGRGSRTVIFRPDVLFLSEASDASGGRPEEFYRDILPPLADLALARTGRELIVKLHPAESERERAKVLVRILSPGRAERCYAHRERAAHGGPPVKSVVWDHDTFHSGI